MMFIILKHGSWITCDKDERPSYKIDYSDDKVKADLTFVTKIPSSILSNMLLQEGNIERKVSMIDHLFGELVWKIALIRLLHCIPKEYSTQYLKHWLQQSRRTKVSAFWRLSYSYHSCQFHYLTRCPNYGRFQLKSEHHSTHSL